MRVDRKRKQNVTVLLKALGWADGEDPRGVRRLESSGDAGEGPTAAQDEALLDIYRKLRPGELPTREAARTLLENLYFNPKRYDLAKVGRYKVNKKLGLEQPLAGGLTIEDIVATIKVPRVAAHGRGDDVRPRGGEPSRSGSRSTHHHFGNRRLRTVGELTRTRSAPACPGWSASCASA